VSHQVTSVLESRGEAQWQDDSVASWQKQAQQRGFAPALGGVGPAKGARSRWSPRTCAGYLRKNGVHYSGSAVLTEFFDRVELDGAAYLILTTVVEDPQYLNETFITSEQFKREPDGSK
jgi:hypothetical protein